MSEEEHKVIAYFEWLSNCKMLNSENKHYIETILNLTKKQQEEIKELKKKLANRLELLNYTISKDYISKDKISNKIEQFKANKKLILELENELGTASITYDIVRNDYCEKMLEDLLEKEI